MKRICVTILIICSLAPLMRAQAQSPGAYSQARLREYSLAIRILRQGLDGGWAREQYFQAFDSGGGHGPADSIAKKEVRSVLESKLPERAIWDEKPPLSAQVTETIAACYAAQNMIRKTEAAPASPPL